MNKKPTLSELKHELDDIAEVGLNPPTSIRVSESVIESCNSNIRNLLIVSNILLFNLNILSFVIYFAIK